jgi:tRNA(fMet)-specific endonuclease VapC
VRWGPGSPTSKRGRREASTGASSVVPRGGYERFSYLFKGDTRGALYAPHLVGVRPVLSFVTIAELAYWADVRQWGRPTRDRLERFLAGFAVRYPDRAMCDHWGAVTAAARRAGRAIAPMDAWIAATALHYRVPLVTHDPNDFAGVPGLTVITAYTPLSPEDPDHQDATSGDEPGEER